MQCSPNLCSRRSSRSAGRHAMTRTGRAIQPGGMSIMPIRGSFRGRRSNGSSAFRIAIWTLTPASLIPAPPTSRTEVGGTGDAPSSADDRTPGTALTRRMTQYAPVLVSQEMTNTWLEAFASDIPCDTGHHRACPLPPDKSFRSPNMPFSGFRRSEDDAASLDMALRRLRLESLRTSGR